MSPGNELINHKELNEIKKIFTKSDGVLFAHGFDKRRGKIFRVRKFENELSKNLIADMFNVSALVQLQLRLH